MKSTISWRARRATAAVVAAASAALAVLVALAVPGRASAQLPPEVFSYASAGASACGSWWKETARQVVSLSVCGLDGVVVENGRPVQLPGPMVVIDLYSCPTRGGECVSEHHESVVGRDELRIDPLLHTAAIRGEIGACTVDVQYWATSRAVTPGGVYEDHTFGGVPGVSAGGGQYVTREAEWTGRVCGENLRGEMAPGWLARGAGAGVYQHEGGSGERADGGPV